MTSHRVAPRRPARPPARLGDLADLVGGRVLGDPDASVSDVTHDSRDAAAGVLFACRPGARTDGHDHAPAAVAAGASALVVERELDLGVPQIVVPSVATVLGTLAAATHGEPSREMTLVGITGTNGKTTTAYLVEAALAACGHTTGLIGTVETRIAGEPVVGVRTTPESTDLQRLLRRMVEAGVTAAAMEVSSHGLALGRVTGTRFAASAFTNLTQDHLDFHADLDDYFAAKARLFAPALTACGVVNVEDRYGARLAASADIPVRRLSPTGAVRGADTVREVVASSEGAHFVATVGGHAVPVTTRLAGDFNVTNALTALALIDVLGLDVTAAAGGIAGVGGVSGRMERVEAGQPFTVLVDYAHTPDSLGHVLRAARRLAGTARVIVVIGCGGDRDRGKRPLMGAAAAAGADLAVLTSDNPRTEDPEVILDEVVAGAREVTGARWQTEPSRHAAIGAALDAAGRGDVVVIAGKGHETTQELATETIDFDDRTVAREHLAAAGYATSAGGG